MHLKSSPIILDVAFGVYEYWKTRLFFDLVMEGMSIVHIDAGKSGYSILFAKLMHDRGKVLAFEPEPDLCDWIRKNIYVNDYKCIELYQCALSDEECSATFYPGNGMGSLVPRPAWEASLQQASNTGETGRL